MFRFKPHSWLSLLILLGLSGASFADGNTAIINQDGHGNEVYIEQVGEENEAIICQEGIDNLASVVQESNGNNADLNPTDFAGFDPLCDFDTLGFLIYQEGNNNQAYLEIEGSRNHTAQWQEGDGNIAELEIVGDKNIAKQVQLGDFNESLAEILGSNNILCHYQEGNNLTHPQITIIGNFKEVQVIQY